MSIEQQKTEVIECRGESHEISILKLDQTTPPLFILHGHTADDLRSEMVIKAMNGELCGCLRFIADFRGAQTLHILSGDRKVKIRIAYYTRTQKSTSGGV